MNINILNLLKFIRRREIIECFSGNSSLNSIDILLKRDHILKLLNVLITDNYIGYDLSFDCLLYFVKTNPTSSNIINYLKELNMSLDVIDFDIINDDYSNFKLQHNLNLDTISPLLHNIEDIEKNSEDLSFFDNCTIHYSNNKLEVIKDHINIFFKYSDDLKIMMSYSLENEKKSTINFVFQHQGIFFNYLKNYEKIKINKDLINMVYC